MADETTVENTENDAETAQAPVTDTPTTDAEATGETTPAKKTAAKKTTRKRTTKKAAAAAPAEAVEAPAEETAESAETTEAAEAPAKKTAAKKTTRKRTTKKAAAPVPAEVETPEATTAPEGETSETPEAPAEAVEAPAKKTAAKKTATKRTTAKKTAAKKAAAPVAEPVETPAEEVADETLEETEAEQAGPPAPAVLFQAPTKTTTRRRTRKTAEPKPVAEPVEAAVEAPAEVEPQATEPAAVPAVEPAAEAAKEEAPTRTRKRSSRNAAPVEEKAADEEPEATDTEPETESETGNESDESSADDGEGGGNGRRRRRRGGRRRRKGANGDADGSDASDTEDRSEDAEAENDDAGKDADADQGEGSTSSRRRRRRRRAGEASGDAATGDDPENTVTKVRQSRTGDDQITALAGSTRLEAKKQRRREGREAGRRRAPIVSEAEFLARRESVDRVMVIRELEDLTQIAVLEDKVLVEHYVARESQTSLIGNVYLGRVQNVLPSMEAAFIDIGKGRNAVLYAGEVNWASLGWKEGQPRKIESVLTSGQKVLVQVTKDPIGHKGARLTSQISLAGRFLVYVPDGTTSGISRKLPDTERNRLKTLLKEIVPDTAGVIVRTAAEGAAEDELTRDVERLKARWEDIEKKANGNAPQLLYGEPDLTLKVVRDLFTEDFAKLVISGDSSWETVKDYVQSVAPDLEERVEKYDGEADAFAAYRIDEQIAKGLDRKVWLPSGGSLIIDRTEAMTVVDVNTGKFTGSGGNLEETVTKNNLEAAEEIVRQLRLRDIGGIIVVDFIDMVLESNRDLVLRRLVECLGRDRTRHQVAEVTSLGLVQMTRKRIGTGLLEAFSENCDACGGRGLVIHEHPVEAGKSSGVAPDEPRSRRRGGRGGRGKGKDEIGTEHRAEPVEESAKTPTPAEFAAMAGQSEGVEKTDEPAAQVVEPVETPAEPAEAPKVTTRTRSRRSKASAPVAEPVETPAESPVAEPVEAAAVESAPEPAAVEPPKVTTRTRSRRSKASTPVTEPVETPAETPAAETPAEPKTPAEPEAPKVTTRTRTRRAATTGRPVLAAVVGSSTASKPEPAPSEPIVTEPVATEPVATEPVAEKEPAPVAPAVEPEATEPESKPEPIVAEPVAAEPVDSKPKVVTRQRRGARREVVSTGEGAVMTATKSEAPVVSNGTASTPAPKVVTRTRGGASRDTTPSQDS
ncbi:Rne/Rng family ribonuclease [Nocardioides sp. NBC_00850]|uniref:Rne/Rng family ribonuclease n=1 Tax=Nocardioides sp. NBC_00850 TaxID=2976001 RepID=UPI00386D1E22|nr:Rne/Rng family ribonuclease [Nocardioides sp. NBC_00850]